MAPRRRKSLPFDNWKKIKNLNYIERKNLEQRRNGGFIFPSRTRSRNVVLRSILPQPRKISRSSIRPSVTLSGNPRDVFEAYQLELQKNVWHDNSHKSVISEPHQSLFLDEALFSRDFRPLPANPPRKTSTPITEYFIKKKSSQSTIKANSPLSTKGNKSVYFYNDTNDKGTNDQDSFNNTSCMQTHISESTNGDSSLCEISSDMSSLEPSASGEQPGHEELSMTSDQSLSINREVENENGNLSPVDCNSTSNHNRTSRTRSIMSIDVSDNLTVLSNAPLPLRNFGNTCYINSVIQGLVVLSNFKKILQIIKRLTLRWNTKSVMHALASTLNIFDEERPYSKFTSAMKESLEELKQRVADHKRLFESSNQQDVVEFLEVLLQGINKELNTPLAQKFFQQFIMIETSQTLICDEDNRKSPTDSDLSICLYLLPTPQKTLQDILESHFKEESLLHHYHCEHKCGSNHHKIIKSGVKCPEILFIVLKRYTNKGRKDYTPIHIDQKLLVPSGRRDFNGYDSFEKSKAYQLKAIVCHSGISTHEGHYTAFVYNHLDGKWYETNDETIELVDYSSVIRKSKTEAYLLMYELVQQ